MGRGYRGFAGTASLIYDLSIGPPSPSPPTESGPAADAAAHLRAAIRGGRIGPGQRIVERPVAEELGVSSIAVRDAFARLVQEGWIERLPRRGVRVRRLGTDEIDDITAARALVEGEAAARAALRVATAGDAGLARIPPAMGAAARRADRSRLLALDEAFHGALWRLAASPTLEELLGNLQARVTPLVRLSLQTYPPAELGRMEPWHAALLDAVRAGPDAARAAAAAHAELTRDRLHAAAVPSRPTMTPGATDA